MDEIPFDFNRKRLSVVVRHGDEHLLDHQGRGRECLRHLPDGD